MAAACFHTNKAKDATAAASLATLQRLAYIIQGNGGGLGGGGIFAAAAAAAAPTAPALRGAGCSSRIRSCLTSIINVGSDYYLESVQIK